MKLQDNAYSSESCHPVHGKAATPSERSDTGGLFLRNASIRWVWPFNALVEATERTVFF